MSKGLLSRAKGRLLRALMPLPFKCRHIEYSAIASVDDEIGAPSERLLQLAFRVLPLAEKVDHQDLAARMHEPPYYPNVWPGEHYKLLTALTKALAPGLVMEIGTYRGLSALSILKELDAAGRLETFDIVPWSSVRHSALRPTDFADNRLSQVLGDLSIPETFERHRSAIERADLIFIDAAKNVVFETRLLASLETVTFKSRPIVVFDDIRQWNMLGVWRSVKRPKLDLTSFGHWTGTGLIDWCGPSYARPND